MITNNQPEPTLLVIGYVWPEPNSSAAGAHMLSLLRLFKQNQWRVIFATPAQQTEHNLDLATEQIESVEITLNDSAFDQYIADLQPAAVLFDRFLMEEQFGWRVAENCPNALRILDTEDLQCLRGARHQAHKQSREFEVNSLHTDLAMREISSIYRCDLSLIISDYEVNLLTDFFNVPEHLLIHIPFMLDLSQASSGLTYSERKHFVTIGNLRHAPNWDSVLYLQSIWPSIRKRLPDCELHIYGAYTPPKATALNDKKNGFLIKDRAACVDKVMGNARVCLSPLRFGAGIKGKFVDAMLNGTPVITTSIGAEGMTGGQQWPGIVADSSQSLVDAAVELYNDEQLWNQKQQQGQQLLQHFYDGEKIGSKLLLRVEQLLADITKHRLSNFTGAMLNHHTLRSTKYLSKWIETKNRLTSNDA